MTLNNTRKTTSNEYNSDSTHTVSIECNSIILKCIKINTIVSWEKRDGFVILLEDYSSDIYRSIGLFIEVAVLELTAVQFND